MITPVKVTIKERLADVDFRRVIARCERYPEAEGGGYYRETDKGKTFLVHPSHLRGIKQILVKLQVSPLIEIQQQAVETARIYTDDRQKMRVGMKVLEKGILVKDAHAEHFVPYMNVDIAWDILKSAEDHKIMPRQMWARLAEIHNMFPELAAAAKIVRDSSESQEKKDWIISALFSHSASLFEGMRYSRRKAEPDAATTNYYLSYWFVILFLKHLGLIDQNGTKEIYLTEAGIMAVDTGKSWKDSMKVV